MTLWGTGKPMREFLHADDLARAIFTAIEKYDLQGPLNVGSGAEISIRDLANLTASLSGFAGEIMWDATKPDGTPRKVLDVSRLQSMGWTAEISLQSGISSTIDWYREAANKGRVRK